MYKIGKQASLLLLLYFKSTKNKYKSANILQSKIALSDSTELIHVK